MCHGKLNLPHSALPVHHLQDTSENKMNRASDTFVHIQAELGQESLLRMLRWVRWHCRPDTWFEIQTLDVWGRARYLSITEAPHNTEFYEWMGKKHFWLFQTAETGKRKAAVLTTILGPPPYMTCILLHKLCKNIHWARRASWGCWDEWDFI